MRNLTGSALTNGKWSRIRVLFCQTEATMLSTFSSDIKRIVIGGSSGNDNAA
jgi:hypothetical protein